MLRAFQVLLQVVPADGAIYAFQVLLQQLCTLHGTLACDVTACDQFQCGHHSMQNESPASSPDNKWCESWPAPVYAPGTWH
eukprot:12405283-Karenia_brevis.AAC.1